MRWEQHVTGVRAVGGASVVVAIEMRWVWRCSAQAGRGSDRMMGVSYVWADGMGGWMDGCRCWWQSRLKSGSFLVSLSCLSCGAGSMLFGSCVALSSRSCSLMRQCSRGSRALVYPFPDLEATFAVSRRVFVGVFARRWEDNPCHSPFGMCSWLA